MTHSPDIDAVRAIFEQKLLSPAGLPRDLNDQGDYANVNSQALWSGWLRARLSPDLPPSFFNVVPATTEVALHGMRVCPKDSGQPAYLRSQLVNHIGLGHSQLVPPLETLLAWPLAMLPAIGEMASLAFLQLPAPNCYARPAATLADHGGMQVWTNDGTAEPVFTKHALLQAFAPSKGLTYSPEHAAIVRALGEELTKMGQNGFNSPKEVCEWQPAAFAAAVVRNLETNSSVTGVNVLNEQRFRLYDCNGKMRMMWDWELLKRLYGIEDCPPYSATVLNLVNLKGYAWLEYNGLHYDAQTPQGVPNFFSLPHIQRLIDEQRNVLPYQGKK